MAAPASDTLARDVRKYVFDHFLEHAVPPVVEGIMEHFRLRRPEAVQVLQSLESSRHLKLVPGTQRILMAFPFSAVATPFRVRRRNGREYYANCAWDAVAFHAMLDEDIRIEGRCHHCAKSIAVELSGGRSNVPAMEPLIYLSLPGSQWWNDIVNTCSNHMVFFAYLSHLDEWRASNPESAPGATLTVDQTHALGFPIYRDKMKLDYTRPGKDQLVAHFRDLGLSGEFWQL
ncbi:MAG TPA: organomercurial lyase [Thermoplasmata archaeon]|nr:organomercurial lyase [Thermoplasmata archaeon]